MHIAYCLKYFFHCVRRVMTSLLECPDGKDCLKHYRLNIGAFDLINLGHSCIYAHHGRNWTNKFIEGFTYFEELPNGDGVRDPVLQYCHKFNETMWEDP